MQPRPQSSPQRSPDYALYRLVTANDAAPYKQRGSGINFGNYQKGLFTVVPINTAAPGDLDSTLGWNPPHADVLAGATSNPAISVRYWNDATGQFVVHNPALTIAAAGAGVAYEFELDVFGRTIFLEVTGGVTATQGVAIFASGHDPKETSG